MVDFYKIVKTNVNPEVNKQVEKFEIISKYKNYSPSLEFDKNITCFCGSCELDISNGALNKTFVFDNQDTTIEVKSGVSVLIKNLSQNARISIEYTNNNAIGGLNVVR